MQSERAAAVPPFFIVGCGRSGSTLLRMMLASHSRLAIPPETWYLIPLVEQLSTDRPLATDEIERAVSIMTSHYRWPDLNLDAADLRRSVAELRQPSLRDVVEVVYQRHLQAEGKVRWGDKTPVYISIVPQLAKMFPGARFIHLVRDGRDVAKSFQAQGWPSRWLHEGTGEWVAALDSTERWMASALREQILEVRYEDLVLDTETTLRETCRFLDEQFEPQMLSWEEKVDEQVPSRERHIHTKLKRKADATDVARWKREMTAREVLVAEAFMGAHLARARYERRFAGRLWTPIFALTRVYCLWALPAVGFSFRALRFARNRTVGLVAAGKRLRSSGSES